jgi:protein-tyrosine phosphatase
MRILFVDAGNYSRSPAAERVTRRLLAEAGLADRIEVASAGLKDKHAGDPPDPRTVAVCAQNGISLDGFVCREITAAEFTTTDLILAMDRENLAQLEARRPPGAPVAVRLFLGDREVPDPYYGGDDGFVTMFHAIETGAKALVGDLRTRGRSIEHQVPQTQAAPRSHP